jgi:hypothetical protein
MYVRNAQIHCVCAWGGGGSLLFTVKPDGTNIGPQSLIRNSWGQMCFGIQNVSELREAILWMYRMPYYLTFPERPGAVPRNHTHDSLSSETFEYSH